MYMILVHITANIMYKIIIILDENYNTIFFIYRIFEIDLKVNKFVSCSFLLYCWLGFAKHVASFFLTNVKYTSSLSKTKNAT